MSTTPTPRLILETLLPHLKAAAAYARSLQNRIAALPEKDAGNNFFATALTDADVAIQNLVEVVILGAFPDIRFYGEEYESSRNTKYFRSLELGGRDDYLVTLDPIDGTRFYMDGHSNYQIILSVLNADDYEAVIAISPAENIYYYALRGEGAFKGSLDMNLEDCTPLRVNPSLRAPISLGSGMSNFASKLKGKYELVDVVVDYSSSEQIPNLNGILSGELSGALKSSGKFIDGGALTFMAREAGCIVTTLDGSSLPPLNTCEDYSLPGLIIAVSEEIYRSLLGVMDDGERVNG
ncbi:MAG: inositol monophosphatase family protein [Cyanobacteria bacterium P01_A01_bin.84]